MPRVAKAKALLTVLLLTASVLTVVFGVNAISSGVDRATAQEQGGDLAAAGCVCHNAVSNSEVKIDVEGFPHAFNAGEQYSVWVNFTGGPEPQETRASGGFNVLATAGTLAPVAEAPQSGFTQATNGGTEITHTRTGAIGAERSFNFLWTAPSSGNAATLVVTVNAVDGSGAPDPNDQWNRMTISSVAAETAPENAIGAATGGHASVHSLGVNFLAYWVGVISFALLFVVYGATFFLFKYGESNATTDHFDRPDAAASSTHAPVRSGAMWLIIGIAILAAIVVFALLRSRGLLGSP
ncbi:MAG TPA: choice-of-anchor V domain-containing protein [Candidatus Thermoplasmatota archaeon]|nr:choice-of-anchor V domain-containing protein [Candidatus Thermoplasmatota archaeon]